MNKKGFEGFIFLGIVRTNMIGIDDHAELRIARYFSMSESENTHTE